MSEQNQTTMTAGNILYADLLFLARVNEALIFVLKWGVCCERQEIIINEIYCEFYAKIRFRNSVLTIYYERGKTEFYVRIIVQFYFPKEKR